MTHEEFIDAIAKYVKLYAPAYDVKVYSPIIAQACLESAYGSSELAIYCRNYFGLKYNKEVSCGGKYLKVGSEQNPDGTYVSSVMEWCTFAEMENGVKGYFDFLFKRTGITRYNNLKGITDPRTYLQTIKDDGYATSINYVDNCMRVIEENNLTRFDDVQPEPTPVVPTGYSNSPLATSKVLSPNYTEGRTCINRITVHHTATNALSGVEIGNIFAKTSRNASCNYGIGNDGSICLIVEEKNRAWTSSNKTNDMMAVTFEVSNSAYGEPWAYSDKAYEATVKLCTDICKRYGITEVFNIDKEIKSVSQSNRAAFANNYAVPKGKLLLTQHNYFASTACPATTWKANWQKLTDDINKRLGGYVPPVPTKPTVAKPTLKNGSKGTEALNLQMDLNYLGYTDDKGNILSEDGVLGNCSIQALKKFQKASGLDADGIYGNASYQAMLKVIV